MKVQYIVTRWNPTVAALVFRDMLLLQDAEPIVYSNSGSVVDCAEYFGLNAQLGELEEADLVVVVKDRADQEVPVPQGELVTHLLEATERQASMSTGNAGPTLKPQGRDNTFDPFAVPPPPNRPGIPVDPTVSVLFG